MFRALRAVRGLLGAAALAALGAGAVPEAGAAVDAQNRPDYGTVELSDQECHEGADFIRNAARSRDYGISAAQFTARVESDIVQVMRLPRELRWFVYGEPEAALLREAVAKVFGQPREPQQHWDDFLARCSAARHRADGLRSRR